jgi:hypothetical protein
VRRALIGGAIALGVLLALAATHLALIEVGREVVTLRTPRPDGTWKETRLWVVDDGDTTWVHSKGAEWLARFEGDPVVELERGGETHRYRAHAVPGPHPRVDRLLREKYGWVDRWVRFLSPCVEDVVPVRLERLPDAA